jgi:hypothetical protein
MTLPVSVPVMMLRRTPFCCGDGGVSMWLM